ncbi:serine hydrolase domain-containing protein [Sphingomicrobium clamense]|uniref:Beta-lactamase family protein n=1 Tax=Sphingomicrobium clamense TaxID=2851013 RepID=A0ABS6V6M1_9SPHN|nr:beta-lactamase family protein [Sphingomicrobium sp. B8]
MLTISIAASLAQTGAVPPDFAQRAEQILEAAYDENAPGAVAIVVDDGQVVFEAGHGLADVEAGTPITPDTVFRYASITKQFTAATIMQLVAEGKISLDAPLSDYLPEYPQPGASATVRQLLNHTSGIMSYTSMPGFMDPENTAKPMTTAQMIDYFDDAEMPAEHGARLAYNNSAYILLGAIIERVTGKNWDAAIRERIANPIGLTSLTSGVYEAGIEGMAKGYSLDDGEVVPAQTIHMSLPHAAGALIGTVGDLATWAEALHSGKVVDAERYAEMIAPTQMADGSTTPFGFGLMNAEVRGAATIGHSGGIFGFSTDSLYIPEEDVFVAVLANSNSPKTDPSFVTRQLAALAIGNPFPEYEKQPLDLAALEGFEGRYEFDDAVRDLRLKDGKLFSQREGSGALEVFHAGDGIYFYGPDSATFFKLARNDEGTPVIRFHSDGAETASVGTRIGDAPKGPEYLDVSTLDVSGLIGTYVWPIGEFTVSQDDKGNVLGQLAGQGQAPMQPVSLTEWHVPQVGAVLTFTIEDGQATSLKLNQRGGELEGPRKQD